MDYKAAYQEMISPNRACWRCSSGDKPTHTHTHKHVSLLIAAPIGSVAAPAGLTPRPLTDTVRKARVINSAPDWLRDEKKKVKSRLMAPGALSETVGVASMFRSSRDEWLVALH